MSDYSNTFSSQEFVPVHNAAGVPNSNNSAGSEDKRLSNRENLADNVSQQVFEAGKKVVEESKTSRIQSIKRFFSTKFNNLRAAATSKKTDSVASKKVKPSSSFGMVDGASAQWAASSHATTKFETFSKKVDKLQAKAAKNIDVSKEARSLRIEIAKAHRAQAKIYSQFFANIKDDNEDKTKFKKALATGEQLIKKLGATVAFESLKKDSDAIKTSHESIDEQLDKVISLTTNFEAFIFKCPDPKLKEQAKNAQIALQVTMAKKVKADVVDTAMESIKDVDQPLEAQTATIAASINNIKKFKKACPSYEAEATQYLKDLNDASSIRYKQVMIKSNELIKDDLKPLKDPKRAKETVERVSRLTRQLKTLRKPPLSEIQDSEFDRTVKGLSEIASVNMEKATQKAMTHFGHVAKEMAKTESAHCEMLVSVSTPTPGGDGISPLSRIANMDIATEEDRRILLAFEGNVREHTAVSVELAKQLSEVQKLIETRPDPNTSPDHNYKLAVDELKLIYMSMDNYAKTLTACAKLYNETRQVIEKLGQSNSAPDGGGLTLESRMIPVIQRMPRHVLYIQDLVNNGSVDGTPENDAFKECAAKLTGLASALNKAA